MADKEYNKLEVPATFNPAQPKFIQVKFKFDMPKEFDKGTYTSYLYGVEDENNQDASLWAYSGLKNALEHLVGIDDDENGVPKTAYRVTQGTIAKLMCFQTDPNDTKSRRYSAIHIAGPYKETYSAQPAASNGAAPAPQQSKGEQQPMIDKQAARDSKFYKPMTDAQMLVATGLINDRGNTLLVAWRFITTNFPDLAQENQRAMAIHLNMEVATNLWRYDGPYEEPEPDPTKALATDPIYQRLEKVTKMPELSARIQEYFTILVEETSSENEFSVKGAFKKMGINTIPNKALFAPSMYADFKKLERYRQYRDQGFEPDAAAEAVVAESETA
jgi:hypothetical protein